MGAEEQEGLSGAEPAESAAEPGGRFSSMSVAQLREALTSLGELTTLHFSILEAIPHAVIGLDNRRIVFANNAAHAVFGWRPDELIGRPMSVLFHQDRDAEQVVERFYGELAGRRTHSIEWVYRRKDGVDVICQTNVARIGDDPAERKIVATHTDITERVRAAEELARSRAQLSAHAEHLQALIERERTEIAREIHDELGQVLTALKLDISWLSRKHPPQEQAARDKLGSMLELVDGTIVAVQRLSQELRPGILDDLGLIEAMEWQAQAFEQRAGIPCRCEIDPEGADGEPCRETATALFRIFQEALTNVARHARASHVEARLVAEGGRVRLKVRDDGVGIGADALQSHASLGLIGIRERVKLLGGEVSIGPADGGGTAVEVELPLTVERPR